MDNSILEIISNVIIPILVGILSFVGGIKSAKIKAEKKKHPLLKSQILISLKTFTEINEIVKKLFDETSADRFLLLGAHNGKSLLRFASAYYEQHREGEGKDQFSVVSYGAVSRYVNFEFDHYYREMLKKSEAYGEICMNVDTMPNCDLRSIYLSEGVKYSNVYFLGRVQDYDDEGNDLVIYCSMAKHEDPEYSEVEKIILKTYIGQIRELVQMSIIS